MLNLKTKMLMILRLDFSVLFPMPAIIKPISSGSSVGVSIALIFKDLKTRCQKRFNTPHRLSGGVH